MIYEKPITPPIVPRIESVVDTDANGMIVMPESMQPAEATAEAVVSSSDVINTVPGMEEHQSGDASTAVARAALSNGRFNNGTIKVENPGPQAIRQSASVGSVKQASVDRFVIPSNPESDTSR